MAVAIAVLATTAVMRIIQAVNSYGRHTTGTRLQVTKQLSEAREHAHRDGYAQGFQAGQTAGRTQEADAKTEPIAIPPGTRWRVQIIPAQVRPR